MSIFCEQPFTLLRSFSVYVITRGDSRRLFSKKKFKELLLTKFHYNGLTELCLYSNLLGGCPFNGRRPLSGMKYPTRESPHRDAASPIKYNGLRARPAAVSNLLSPLVI